MASSEEIRREDLPRYTFDLRGGVDRVCQSTAFRTSLKSREFLRYVVDHALSGNVDLLKERLIGMSLMGRNADYDTAIASSL